MAFSTIVYDVSVTMTMNRGMAASIEDINFGNMMVLTNPNGGGGSQPTGGGTAVKISDGIIYHLRDSIGNTINKPIVVL